MKLVTEEQQAGGLMMSLPVFLWKSLPQSGKPAERVEKPVPARWKSLPKSGKPAEKGRETQ